MAIIFHKWFANRSNTASSATFRNNKKTRAATAEETIADLRQTIEALNAEHAVTKQAFQAVFELNATLLQNNQTLMEENRKLRLDNQTLKDKASRVALEQFLADSPPDVAMPIDFAIGEGTLPGPSAEIYL